MNFIYFFYLIDLNEKYGTLNSVVVEEMKQTKVDVEGIFLFCLFILIILFIFEYLLDFVLTPNYLIQEKKNTN